MSLYSAKNKLSLSALLLLLGQGWTLPALSEDDNNAPQTSATKPLEEVIVTARKREESVLDVPIAITAFGADVLSSPTISDISNLAALAPNVEFSTSPPISGTSNAAAVFIRGIGQNDFLATNDPGVGVYLDGVYIARSVGGVLKVNDIERVEILRGPQGTLFGKNTIGGAVNVISRLPASEARGSVAVTGGSKDRQDLALSAEGPLADNLTGRLSLLDENRDGYVERTLDGKDQGNINRSTLKGLLHWQPAEHMDFRFSGDYTHQRQNGAAEVMIDITEGRDLSTLPPGEPLTNWELFNALIAGPQFDTQWDTRWLPTGDGFNTFSTGPSQDDLEVKGVSVSGDIELSPSLTLTSVTGYRAMEGTYARDADGSPLAYGSVVNRDEQSQFSEELRLTGSSGESLTWTLGAFYLQEAITNQQDVVFLGGLFEATGGAADATFDVNNEVDVDSRALFGQLSWTHKAWEVTGGLRMTREQKEFFIDNATVNTGVQLIGPQHKPADVWREVSPGLNISYDLNEHSMLYASYSEGFKSGGYNGRLVNPATDTQSGTPVIDTFDPENATTYELGFKQQYDWLYLQGAVFTTDYTNMQVSVLTIGANNLIAVTIDNAAKAAIDGAEFEAVVTLADNVRLRTGLGYLDARYVELEQGALLNKNQKLQKIPEWNSFVRGEYDYSLTHYGRLTSALEFSYKSKTYNDPLNTESIAQPAFTLVNASLSWLNPQETIKASLFCNNLTDETYLLSGVSELASVGISSATYGRQREFGLALEYSF
jgi:iron complex outermembrane receptor protein